MQREMLLAEVYEIEQRINEVFGDTYPLQAPDLPSRRRKRSGSKSSKPVSAPVWKPPAIRKLRDGENAYRIDFVYRDQSHIEYHTDPNLLKAFVSAGLPDVDVLSITTGWLVGRKDWEQKDVLYTLPDTE
ncbi:MAG: hypothetical protein AAF492_01700 [Verrucomicrobiota bacterium]